MTHQLTNIAPKTGKSGTSKRFITSPGTNSSTACYHDYLSKICFCMGKTPLLVNRYHWMEWGAQEEETQIQEQNQGDQTCNCWNNRTPRGLLSRSHQKSGDGLQGIARRDRLVASTICLTNVFTTSLAWHLSDWVALPKNPDWCMWHTPSNVFASTRSMTKLSPPGFPLEKKKPLNCFELHRYCIQQDFVSGQDCSLGHRFSFPPPLGSYTGPMSIWRRLIVAKGKSRIPCCPNLGALSQQSCKTASRPRTGGRPKKALLTQHSCNSSFS